MRIWFDTELCISSDDLACPSDRVFNPHARWLRLDPQFKIFRIVIQFAAVYMVYVFAWQQLSTKFDLDHMSTFVNPLAIWCSDPAITRVGDIFTLHAANTATFSRGASSGRSQRVSAVTARSLVMDEA